MSETFSASLWQGGMEVASVSAADKKAVEREIAHYAAVYSQDGPVEVRYSWATWEAASRNPKEIQ